MGSGSCGDDAVWDGGRLPWEWRTETRTVRAVPLPSGQRRPESEGVDGRLRKPRGVVSGGPGSSDPKL